MTTSPDSVTYTQTVSELGAPSSAFDWVSTYRPNDPWAGLFGFASDTGLFEWFDGSNWGHFAWLESPSTQSFYGNVTVGTAGNTQSGVTLGYLSSSATVQSTGPATDVDLWLRTQGAGVVKARTMRLANTTMALSGAQAINQYAWYADINFSGTATGYVRGATVVVSSDTAVTAAAPYGLYWMDAHGNCDTGFVGPRIAINAGLNLRGTVGAGATDDTFCQWPAAQGTFSASANQRGTAATSGQSQGVGYAGGDQAWLYSGATYFSALVGREIDVAIYSGASAAQRLGLNIQSYGGIHGNDFDDALRIGAKGYSAGVGWLKAISFRPRAVDPTDGQLISYTPYVPGSLTAIAETDPPAQTKRGINLTAYLFSDAAFMMAGGTRFEPTGALSVGPGSLSSSTSSVALDVSGNKVSAVASIAAGSNYVVGDQVYSDDGTILTVDTIDGSGKPTAVTIEQAGGVVGAAPANPRTFYAGSGSGLTVNLTWTAVTALSVQPSGGAIYMSGIQASTSYANDAAAAAGGVAVGQLYRNGSVVQVRIV